MFSDDRHKSDLKHECELPIEEDVTSRYISSGYFISLRRLFRMWMMVDQNKPCSRTFFKSTFIIMREKINHLNDYYYMIHPFSSFRCQWESFMIVLLATQLMVVPLYVIINYAWMWYFCAVIDVFNLIDIVLMFNTGFQSGDTSTIILHPRLVAKHYLRTLFVVDLLGLFQFHYFAPLIMLCVDPKTYTYFLQTKTMDLLNCLKLFRLVRLFNYLDRLRDFKRSNMYFMKVMKVALLVFIVFLWMLGLIYIYTSRNIPFEHRHSMLTIAIRRCLFMLYLYGVYEHPIDTITIVSQLICLTCGFLLNLLILCQMLQIRTRYSWSSKKLYQMMKQLTEFMRYRSLPPMIQSRIIKYCDFRFQLNYYKEQDIMKILSPQLQQEVMLQAHVHLLSKVRLFEDIPMAILFEIIYRMKVNFYMPSDVVITSGSHSEAMYFINSGSVAIYSATGKEVDHLSDGDHFGELSLMTDFKHSTVTIIAIDCCEMYVLNRNDFVAELEQHPDVHDNVMRYVRNYLGKTYSAETEVDETISMVSMYQYYG